MGKSDLLVLTCGCTAVWPSAVPSHISCHHNVSIGLLPSDFSKQDAGTALRSPITEGLHAIYPKNSLTKVHSGVKEKQAWTFQSWRLVLITPLLCSNGSHWLVMVLGGGEGDPIFSSEGKEWRHFLQWLSSKSMWHLWWSWLYPWPQGDGNQGYPVRSSYSLDTVIGLGMRHYPKPGPPEWISGFCLKYSSGSHLVTLKRKLVWK